MAIRPARMAGLFVIPAIHEVHTPDAKSRNRFKIDRKVMRNNNFVKKYAKALAIYRERAIIKVR
jgi:hypothetical protein